MNTPSSDTFTPGRDQSPKTSVHDSHEALLIQKWQEVKARIERAKSLCAREGQNVQLLAVSKTFPLEDILILKGQGQMSFGENYIQEAVGKIDLAQKTRVMNDAQWHCIGPLQSNKTKWVAECFDWVHTLERAKHAHRLNEQRPEHLNPLNVLIQVKVDAGPNKSGVLIDDVLPLAREILSCPRLRLRGLMTLPDFTPEYDQQLKIHQKGRSVFEMLRQALGHEHIDTLSMGMTQDLEAAVAAGSTMLRIGTAIFGGRTQKAPVSAVG